jgi:hypothetical protein
MVCMVDVKLIQGDCLDRMKELDANSVDSIVTDPPYGLSFMGKNWDHGIPGEQFWREALRIAKPGAFLLAFGGTRTYHRLACAIEDAGWELRDSIGVPHESGDWGDCPWLMAWVYGSGFPKSRDIGKDIEKRNVGGIKNMEVIGERPGLNNEDGTHGFSYQKEYVPGKSIGGKQLQGTIPVYKINNEWQGWGTALKPAWEPIIVARKPIEGTVAANVLKWGTGALNIDGCRVELDGDYKCKANGRPSQTGLGDNYNPAAANQPDTLGRWPANLILTYPEDEYMLRDNVTHDQLHKLADWINENTKH